MDPRWREGRLDQPARRGRPAAPQLSRAHRRWRMGGRGRDRPHRPHTLSFRWLAAPFHLRRRGARYCLRAARCQAARAGALSPLSVLLSPCARQPERWGRWMRSWPQPRSTKELQVGVGLRAAGDRQAGPQKGVASGKPDGSHPPPDSRLLFRMCFGRIPQFVTGPGQVIQEGFAPLPVL